MHVAISKPAYGTGTAKHSSGGFDVDIQRQLEMLERREGIKGIIAGWGFSRGHQLEYRLYNK